MACGFSPFRLAVRGWSERFRTREALPGADEDLQCLVRFDRSTISKALDMVASRFGQPGSMLKRLDPFGHRADVKRAGHG
jgi:hypothetical protein